MKFTDGSLNDVLYRPIHGAPDPSRDVQYVSGVAATIASRNFARGMAAGVEIAQAAEKVTGLPTLFTSNTTGPYGGVGWLTGYESIAALDAAADKIAADAAFVKLVDSTKGCFVDGITQQTIFRKLA